MFYKGVLVMEYFEGNIEFVKEHEYEIKNNGKKKELECVYDSQKSFYKKSYIISYGNLIYLQSYDTIVAVLGNH